MAFTQRITETVLQGGLETARSRDYVATNRQSLDEPMGANVTDLAAIVALDVSAIKALFIVCDQDCTFETNGTKATETLTLAGNAADAETVTLDTKVYTFQTTLTNVDGNVLIGATASDSIDNLIAAITLGSGSGTTYAASMTKHTAATAEVAAGDTMLATAISVGTGGNSIATAETLITGGSQWGAGTMSGGVVVDDTINLTAGKPYVWTDDSYFANLLTVDVTKVHLTNATAKAATLKLEAVQDATP